MIQYFFKKHKIYRSDNLLLKDVILELRFMFDDQALMVKFLLFIKDRI